MSLLKVFPQRFHGNPQAQRAVRGEGEPVTSRDSRVAMVAVVYDEFGLCSLTLGHSVLALNQQRSACIHDQVCVCVDISVYE